MAHIGPDEKDAVTVRYVRCRGVKRTKIEQPTTAARDPNWTSSELTDGAAFDERRALGPRLTRIFCDKIA